MSEQYVLHQFSHGYCVARLTSSINFNWANQIVTIPYVGVNIHSRQYYKIGREFSGETSVSSGYTIRKPITKEENPEYFV